MVRSLITSCQVLAGEDTSQGVRITEEQITVIVSELLEDELSNAPEFVRELFSKVLNQNAQYVNITNEVEKLADAYIGEEVVGQTSYADCTHIALATINKADILASWNFKHIVNIDRIGVITL